MKELLELRLELSRTSVKKYESMRGASAGTGGYMAFCNSEARPAPSAGQGGWCKRRTFPRTTCPISPSPETSPEVATRNSWSCCSAPFRGTLSELIRTAFIPKDGCRFIVADFSAIEARVLAWLAGEEWVLEEFRGRGKIYEATASRMFHIPQETIVRGHPNYEYRQKGKQATLSCGYGGGVGALKAMARRCRRRRCSRW